MPTETIEIWEHISFDKKGNAVSWTQSLDGGTTWQDVEHFYGSIPFVYVDIDYQTSRKLLKP